VSISPEPSQPPAQTRAPQQSPRDRWALAGAAALAVFLAFHLVAITVRALPSAEGAMNRAAWRDPTVQKEMAAWSARLGHLGLHRSPQALAAALYPLAQREVRVHRALVAPFHWYYDCCGTYQSWQMFVAPHRHPARLRIERYEGGAWHLLFREGDPRATWMARQLGDTRFRSVIFRLGWPGYRGALDHFADWIARRAAAGFPGAQKVRLIFSRADTPSPEQVRAGAAPPAVDDAPVVRELARFRAGATR